MIAKNNIFNIRAGRAQWLGMTGTCKGFVEFETREHGIRAWLVVRESYYRVAYHVFNYLRRNRQLARREGAFDKDVKLVLTCTLSRLLVEYGTDKD
jgi:hypothetical protein